MFVPEGVVTNERMSRLMDTSDEWIRQRTGIEERRYARAGTSSCDLGIEAAKRALEDAGLEAADIDLIVFATMTPAHYFPGNGGLLAAALGLHETPALDIRMQCAGFLSGLQVADAFIRSGTYRRVLLVGAECHASLYPWSEAEWAVMFGDSEGPVSPEAYAWGTAQRDRAVIFGDGAGAFVLEAHDEDDGRGFLGFEMRTDGAHWDKLYVPGGGSASFPYFSPKQFEENKTIPVVEGRQVFRLATTAMPAIVRETLEKHGSLSKPFLCSSCTRPTCASTNRSRRGSGFPTRRSSTTSRDTATRRPRRFRSSSTRRSRPAGSARATSSASPLSARGFTGGRDSCARN